MTDTSAPAEVVQELTAVIASQQRLLKAALDAIDTGRSYPLFVVRDQLRNFLADHALRIADTRPVASTLDAETASEGDRWVDISPSQLAAIRRETVEACAKASAIARSLTPKQRRGLLTAPSTPHGNMWLNCHGRTKSSLVALGLASGYGDWCTVTPLGKEVRRDLEAFSPGKTGSAKESGDA